MSVAATQRLEAAVPGGNRGVLAVARAWQQAGTTFALVLVTHAEGSTYRKPGAFAVVAADGRRQGAISGGCLEPALVELAQRALQDGRPRSASFDTRGEDDLVFGSGSGCRGLMHVLAFPLPSAAGTRLLAALDGAQARGSSLQVALWLGEHDGATGRGLARHGDAEVELEPCDDGVRLQLRGVLAGESAGDNVAMFAIRPPAHVLLLGAGPEVLPLLRFAQALGWRCAVADHREALLEAAIAAGAEAVVLARPQAALLQLAGVRFDAVLAVSHLASADLAALQALAASDVAYVGLLGPPSRRDELLALLDPDQRHALQARLHAPVGLPLGGEGPEAIALAIMAGLQQHLHAR